MLPDKSCFSCLILKTFKNHDFCAIVHVCIISTYILTDFILGDFSLKKK